ncbi:MAG: M28 family peptidase [Phycisphaerales bacterium]
MLDLIPLTVGLLATASTVIVEPIADDESIRLTTSSDRAAQLEYEQALRAEVSNDELRRWHDLIASEPHIAGTEGDRRNTERIAAAFHAMDLEVEVQELWVYLPRPIDAEVRIESPRAMSLPLVEYPVAEDPDTGHAGLTIGWNAYSGSGVATGEIVYANYGTKDDFELLGELGVSCEGKIVLARYGGNYRGYKAKFAEEAGAIGLLIFTDPAEAGRAGLAYPMGGYANPSSIQRGSILTLPWTGDPLTPFEPATLNADRLDPEEAPLPRIPVQPIGWAAAEEIMSRMTGDEVIEPWRGGLESVYRLTGGPELRVTVRVEQERAIRRVWNVLGTLPGKTEPERLVLVGSHHDAWNFGASDPTAGTIVTLEMARAFSALARRGERPDRSLVFATWDAEEFGIIGSSEWVEANRARLFEHGVAYLNLDMSAMGPRFGPSAAPALQTLVIDASRYTRAPTIDAAADSSNRTVFDEWSERSSAASAAEKPRVGALGGGSDHVGFYCHAGVPSMSFGAGGAAGTAYHSNYDTRHWYRLAVGDDYESARMLAQIGVTSLARLARSTALPYDARRYATESRAQWNDLERRFGASRLDRWRERGSLSSDATTSITEGIDRLERQASMTMSHLVEALDSDALDASTIGQINEILIGLEREWMDDAGIPGRPWFRHLYAAPDETSGYAAWLLPGLRHALEHDDPAEFHAESQRLSAIFDALTARLGEIDDLVHAQSTTSP